jgi:hypothetical protein
MGIFCDFFHSHELSGIFWRFLRSSKRVPPMSWAAQIYGQMPVKRHVLRRSCSSPNCLMFCRGHVQVPTAGCSAAVMFKSKLPDFWTRLCSSPSCRMFSCGHVQVPTSEWLASVLFKSEIPEVRPRLCSSPTYWGLSLSHCLTAVCWVLVKTELPVDES